MNVLVRSVFVAAVMLFASQWAAAQTASCPSGYAIQSTSPTGVTCIAVPDVRPLQQQDARLVNMINTVSTRVDGLTEADLVGRWAVSGTTTCLQSTNGFSTTTLSPLIPATGSTFVSHFTGSSNGTRTFNAGGSGEASGTTYTLGMPGAFFSTGSAGVTSTGGVSETTFSASFTWSISAEGTLLINDDSSIAQSFVQPPSRVGFTVTIENLPGYVGFVSKDKRTITMTHSALAIETSVLRDSAGVEQSRTPRFCTRHRVMTRLPN
jgi:hypothetical protein